MPCMFCRSEENLTSEHVFPAFMGGELQVSDGSCSRCNGEFAAWEGEIKKQTALLLHLLGIENRYGEVPRAKMEVKVRGMEVEGLSGLREPDGTINLQDKVQEIVEPDGKKHRKGFFVSQQNAEKFLARARARGEKTSELSVPDEVVYDASFRLTLRFCMSLEARKVVAKIALASIAYKYGIAYALSPQFDRLRQARVATTPKSLPLNIFCNKQFMAAQTRTPHQHSVIGYLSAGLRKGWILVTLFGGLTYVVEVTDAYNESSSRQFSIFYDAATKKTFNPVLLADEMSLVQIALSKDTAFENRNAVDAQWSPIIEAYCAAAEIMLERILPEG